MEFMQKVDTKMNDFGALIIFGLHTKKWTRNEGTLGH